MTAIISVRIPEQDYSILNDEVRYGFLNFLVPYYTKVSDDETGFHIAKFMRELRTGKVDEFMKRLKVFFTGIPYDLSDDTERHYQAIFYIVFTLIGQFVEDGSPQFSWSC